MPLFNRGIFQLLSAATAWDSAADYRVLLVDSGYTFDPDDNFVSELGAGAELSGVSGYARQSTASRTVTEDDAGNRVVLNMATTAFGALGAGDTIGGAIVYRHTGADDSANPLLGYIDLTNTPTNGGTFSIDWNDTDGLWYADSP